MKILPHTGQINPGSLMAAAFIRKTYSAPTNAREIGRHTSVHCDSCGGHLNNQPPSHIRETGLPIAPVLKCSCPEN